MTAAAIINVGGTSYEYCNKRFTHKKGDEGSKLAEEMIARRQNSTVKYL
jgi:hypothetical protein